VFPEIAVRPLTGTPDMDRGRTRDQGRTKAKELRTKDLQDFLRRLSLPDLGIRGRLNLRLQ
jgi:hypothetical protein